MAWPQFLFSIEHEANLAYTYARIFTYYVLVGAGLAVTVTIFTPEILHLMTARAYAGAGEVVLLLSVGILLTGIAMTMGVVPSLIKRTVAFFPALVFPALVNLALNATLVPQLGMRGAAWASLITGASMVAIMFVASRTMLPVRYETRRLLIILAVASAAVALGSQVSTGSLVLDVAIKAAILMATLPALWLFRFPEARESETIRKLMHRIFLLKSYRSRRDV
jgi:O-antigen/teichoic acid export membrane protein